MTTKRKKILLKKKKLIHQFKFLEFAVIFHITVKAQTASVSGNKLKNYTVPIKFKIITHQYHIKTVKQQYF